MGASIVLFASYIAEISVTVTEIAETILIASGENMILDAAALGLENIGGSLVADAVLAVLNSPVFKIFNVFDKYAGTLYSVGKKASKAMDEYDRFVKAQNEVEDAIGDFCDYAAGKTQAMKILMGQALQVRKVIQDVHDCNLSKADREASRIKVKKVKEAFEKLKQPYNGNEQKMKKQSQDIGSILLRYGMRQVFGANLGGCFDAVEGSADAADKASRLFQSLKDKPNAQKFFATHAHDLQCATHSNGGTSKIKCHTNVNAVKNTVLNQDYCENKNNGRKLDELDDLYKELNLTTAGYKWDIPYPVEFLCGDQGFINVTSFDEAVKCNVETMSEVMIDYSRSKHWPKIVEKGGCKTVLFAASEDPTDEFCTILRLPEGKGSKMKYVKSPYGGDRGSFMDMPYCESMEQLTTSTLAAMTNVSPEFDLIRVIYAPNGEVCSDSVGAHRIVIDGPVLDLPPKVTTGSNMPRPINTTTTTEQKMDHTMIIAILVIGAVHLAITLMKLLSTKQEKPEYEAKNSKMVEKWYHKNSELEDETFEDMPRP